MKSKPVVTVALYGAGWTGQPARVPALVRFVIGRGGHVFERIAPNVAVWFGVRLQKANANAEQPREEKP